jgi:hypothetical protein
MSTLSGVSHAQVEEFQRGDSLRIRRRDDGQPIDRYDRTPPQVQEQHALVKECAAALKAICDAFPKIELGRSAGLRLLRRCEVARDSFNRLERRDAQILSAFERYTAWERVGSGRRG